MYMSLVKPNGRMETIQLPRPMSGVVSFQRNFINLDELTEIRLRSFSIDGWQFESIEITHRSSVYLFLNSAQHVLTKYSGIVSYTPI